jgi:hypothetical protein
MIEQSLRQSQRIAIVQPLTVQATGIFSSNTNFFPDFYFGSNLVITECQTLHGNGVWHLWCLPWALGFDPRAWRHAPGDAMGLLSRAAENLGRHCFSDVALVRFPISGSRCSRASSRCVLSPDSLLRCADWLTIQVHRDHSA